MARLRRCVYSTRVPPDDPTPTATESAVAQLCLNCGICCNGVLFRDVELQPRDAVVKLTALGLPIKNRKFPQPCAALGADCRCRVYADRPKRCRDFDCALLQSVATGEVEVPAALRVIKQTLKRAGEVRKFLRELGDTTEHQPLSRRFRNVKRRVESGPLDEDTAATFADLSLAVHHLNVVLQQKFYSDSNE